MHAHNHVTPEEAVIVSCFDLIWAHQYSIADAGEPVCQLQRPFMAATARVIWLCACVS